MVDKQDIGDIGREVQIALFKVVPALFEPKAENQWVLYKLMEKPSWKAIIDEGWINSQPGIDSQEWDIARPWFLFYN